VTPGYEIGMSDAVRSRRYRSRKKRGERLVSIRLAQEEIERLAAHGYTVQPGLPLGAVVETFISDTLAQMTVTP
jgi:hypothetical protein